MKAYKTFEQDTDRNGQHYEPGRTYRTYKAYKPGNTLYRIDKDKLREYGYSAYKTVKGIFYYGEWKYGLTRCYEVNLGGTIVDNGEEDCYKELYSSRITVVREVTAPEVATLFGHPIRVSCGGKWNFVNADGELLLGTWYDHAGEFLEDGIALIQLNGKTSYIDEGGKPITDVWFDYGGGFVNGEAMVELGGRMYVLFRDGGYALHPLDSTIGALFRGERVYVGPGQYIKLA